MKSKKLLIVLTVSALTVGLFSCKKSNDGVTGDDEATVLSMSSDQATSDFLADDATDVMLTVAEEQNLGRYTDPASTNSIVCATVSVTPQTGFPRTITITFDSTCTGPNGMVRSGVIQIVISDTLRHPGST